MTTRRLLWLTDLHLDFVEAGVLERFYEAVRAESPDLILAGGDIAEARTFVSALEQLQARAGVPVCFVLGNHDYYRSSIAAVRAEARRLSRTHGAIH